MEKKAGAGKKAGVAKADPVATPTPQQGEKKMARDEPLRPCAQLPNHLLKNARILPQRSAILKLLPKDRVFVEVGVALGDYSEKIMEICQPKLFTAIDIFMIHSKGQQLWKKSKSELFGEGTHEDYYKKRFAGQINAGRVRVLSGDSVEMLEQLDDSSVDIFYIDANHTYEAVSRELEVVGNKVRNDGWIILNDYIMHGGVQKRAYGVIQAAHEFMIANNWRMEYLALHRFMHCDVALRKADQPPPKPAA